MSELRGDKKKGGVSMPTEPDETQAEDKSKDQDTKSSMQLNEDIIRERNNCQDELLAVTEQMQEMFRHDGKQRRIFEEEYDMLEEEYDMLEEKIRPSDEERTKLKRALEDAYKCKDREFLELRKQMEADMERERKKHKDDMEELNRNQKEALKRQAKDHADREKAQAQEYEDRICRLEKLNRNQKEAFERQAKDHADREKAQAQEYENRICRLEELNHKQNVVFEWRAKEQADRETARAQEQEDRIMEREDKNPLNTIESNGEFPLYRAAAGGHFNEVKSLLERGANPSLSTPFGWTSLHWAANNGHENVVKILLTYGAYVNPKSNRRQTPLSMAKTTAIQQLLRQHGAQ